MDDISSGFFKLPELENILLKPEEKYDFPTSGMLHSDKFVNLLEAIFEDRLYDIFNILEGHLLQDQLSNLKRTELADFCRHVFIINKDKIGWQVVDKYLLLTNEKIGKASWEKPKFIFTDDFNQMLSSIYRWELSSDQVRLMLEYVNKNKVESLSKEKIIENLNNNYHFWNTRNIFLLFEDLISQHVNHKNEFKRFQPLLDSIIDLIFERITSKSEELKKRVAFLIIFSRGLVKIDFERFQKIQDISTRIWIELENSLSKVDVDSYRYLYSVIYAHLGSNYYQYNIDFIHKRQLINLIIATFFQFPEVNIGEWINKLANSEVDELIVEYILNGYLSVVNILDEYTKELPKSEIYNKIHNLFLQVSHSLFNMATSYLTELTNTPELDNLATYHLNKFSSQPEKFRIIKSMIRIRMRCMEYLTYYDNSLNFTIDEVKVMTEIQEFLNDSSSKLLFQSNLLMLTNNYSFQNLLAKIEYEAEMTNSIINSTTFENEIIILTSKIMEEIKKHYQDTGILETSELDKLLYYISQWLLYFKEHSFLYQDFVMICSPIITIIMVQLVQAYHEMNKNILAFLMYLNMQHFATVMRKAMDLIGDDPKDKPTSYYANDFRDMVKEWDITLNVELNQVTDSIKNIQGLSGVGNIQSGMLEDELLMGFLNLTSNFEELIKEINQGTSMAELEKIVLNDSGGGNHLYQRIGEFSEKPLNFPLIKNVQIYNAALSIIPVEINISASLLDLDIDSMIAFFFREES